MSSKVDFKLYLITDRKVISARYSLLSAVREALKGGVKAVQIREKDLETREVLKLAYGMRELTSKYKAKLFINDRFDIASAVGADGVHLTQNSVPADAVRKVLKSKLLIGVSTHSLNEAKEAERSGADFITLGPIYGTPSKLKYGKPLGIDALRQVSSKLRIPIFAIGGIKKNKVAEVKNKGAFGVSMISEIFGAEDIKGKTRELIQAVEDI